MQAFCAGGDVKWVVAACRSGDPSPGLEYFNTEYDMDLNVARCGCVDACGSSGPGTRSGLR
eukprot:355356-Chlamydomonas_euryale.AAC.3